MIRLSIVLLMAVSPGIIHEACGHGVGAETLPPQRLGDRQVFIEVNAVSTEDPGIDQQLTFRLMDAQTSEAVGGVTYEIKASKQDIVLFDERFESGSGTLAVDLVHSDSGGISVEKRASGIFGFISGDTDLARVTGPYFDYGGLYRFEIGVLTAGGFSNSLDPPLEWSSGVSIADTTTYDIEDANYGRQTLTHISYYDVIEDFSYDPLTSSVSFEMPFDGSLDSINQTSVVHEEFTVSKEFGDLMVSDMSASVNGVVMPQEAVQIDDFTEGRRIVHLTVVKSNILELYDQGRFREDRMSFVIGPSQDGLPLATVTRNGQFRVVMETDPAEARSGQELEVRYKLLDVFLKDRPVRVDYDLYVVQEDRMLFSTRGASNDEAGRFDSVRFSVPEQSAGIIYVHFENLAGNSLASAKLPIAVDRIPPTAASIPEWIRDNAGAWSAGIIGDEEFVAGIQWLISKDVIMIPQTQAAAGPAGAIPSWIRSAAHAWSMGMTSDEEFVAGIEFLVSNGIIRV